jgi:hypothetical protein
MLLGSQSLAASLQLQLLWGSIKGQSKNLIGFYAKVHSENQRISE